MKQPTTLVDCVRVAKAWRKREGTNPPFSWGHPFLQRELGDAYPGKIYVVGADPNTGKSMFVLDVVTSCPERSLVLSYEDDPAEFGERVEHIHQRTLERVRIAFPTGGPIAARPIIDEAAAWGARLLVVDYLNQLSYDGEGRTYARHDDLREIMREFQAKAREHGMVLLLVAQTKNRPREDREKTPSMFDLAECSGIARVAKAVVMLHSPQKGVMIATVGKSKSTPVGGTATYQRGANGWLQEVTQPEAGDLPTDLFS